MRKIQLKDAKANLSAVVDQATQGKPSVITRHGKPVARLVPSSGGSEKAQAGAAAQRIRERAKALKLGPFDWDSLLADRDMGRP